MDTRISNEGDGSNQRSESGSDWIGLSNSNSNCNSGSNWSKNSEEKSVNSDENQNEESKIIENNERNYKHWSKDQSWHKIIAKSRNRKRKDRNFEDYKSSEDLGSNQKKISRRRMRSRKNSSRFQENSKVEQSKIMDEQKLIDEFATILIKQNISISDNPPINFNDTKIPEEWKRIFDLVLKRAKKLFAIKSEKNKKEREVNLSTTSINNKPEEEKNFKKIVIFYIFYFRNI